MDINVNMCLKICSREDFCITISFLFLIFNQMTDSLLFLCQTNPVSGHIVGI